MLRSCSTVLLDIASSGRESFLERHLPERRDGRQFLSSLGRAFLSRPEVLRMKSFVCHDGPDRVACSKEVLKECNSVDGESITCVCACPRFKNFHEKVWRHLPCASGKPSKKLRSSSWASVVAARTLVFTLSLFEAQDTGALESVRLILAHWCGWR